MTYKQCSRLVSRPLLLFLILMLASTASAEWKEKVLYSFQGLPDGSVPAGGVVFDTHGNLYGATTEGGANSCPGIAQCGTVYQLTPPATKGDAWTETVLYIFLGKNHNDGNTPAGGVMIDAAGNLYGTTAYGGAGSCILLGTNVGCGTVYELSPPTQKGGAWRETVLYNFKGDTDGQLPIGDLVFDKQGNLHGATQYGGLRIVQPVFLPALRNCVQAEPAEDEGRQVDGEGAARIQGWYGRSQSQWRLGL